MEAGGEGEGKAAPVPAVRVLVVDDSPVDRKVVELLLRNHKGGAAPFHVTAVDSGKKAMEHLRLMGQESLDSSAAHANELTVDIVLTDYCMPEMTGYDLLKAIKALSSPNPIPVVVMSSENEPQRISRCLTAGAEDFILKPLKTKDVQCLRNCSNAARPPKDDAVADAHQCESLSSRKPRSDQMATPGHRSQLTGLTMVRNASSIEVSHYLQFLFKFVLLAYAVLCLSELLHRWFNGSVLSLWSA
ncbi:two-component response regulator ORR2-like isoform X2 [Miscanthus floridulus]|uniref:two-component response regulator ORR2-like isoform X2 n=1 Tax=Miscanthus floridulus TaxID=154761 RepID=UPI003457E338